MTEFSLHILTISGRSSGAKLLAEWDLMFRFPTPKYTESAPPWIAAWRHSKFPAGAIISKSLLSIESKDSHSLNMFVYLAGDNQSHHYEKYSITRSPRMPCGAPVFPCESAGIFKPQDRNHRTRPTRVRSSLLSGKDGRFEP